MRTHFNKTTARNTLLTGAFALLVLIAAPVGLDASTLRFTTIGTYGSFVPTGLPDAMTGTQFQLVWEQSSDPTPTASIPNQTFIGNVTAVYSAGPLTGNYPTGDFYPRFYTGSGGGGYLFDAYEDGNHSGNEVFLFFQAPQLFTGTTAAPHFAPGLWTGNTGTNIIYGTDANNRYNLENVTLNIQDVGVPEPGMLAVTGLALGAMAHTRRRARR
jgi:hypothetical protein